MKENIVRALIDARIIKATKEKVSSKLSCIARNMGSKIIGESTYASMLPDFWEFDLDDPYDANRVIDASQNNNDMELGYVYDSLRFGVNFEIVLRSYGEKTNMLRASMNGIPVFMEEEGTLKCYTPAKDWENHMEKLYEHASKLEDQRLKQLKVEEKEKDKKDKKTFLQKLKLLWGYE